MRYLSSLLVLVVLWSELAWAQQPAQAERLLRFSPQSVELRRNQGSWQICAGSTCLKDFGADQENARAALRLIQSLSLTEYGTVGEPRPIVEYWLSHGQAPMGLRLPMGSTTLDPDSLRVEAINGHWCVRNDQHVFFNFGSSADQARETLAIIRRHGFSRVAFLGRPPALMMVFLGDVERRVHQPVQHPKLAEMKSPEAVKLQKELGAAFQPTIALMGIRQLAPASVLGAADGMRQPFDWRQVQVRSQGQTWHLVAGTTLLGVFREERSARTALALIQHYRCTERCQLGAPPRFTYYLVDGRAPHGACIGLSLTTIRPDQLTVQQVGTDWQICERGRPLLNFHQQPEQANEALRIIQQTQLDGYYRFGDDEAAVFWIRSRS